MSTIRQLVITAVGPDRPGLVDELTGLLLEHGANVADSRMVNLRGQFALLLLAEAPPEGADELARRLDAAARKIGLGISVSAPSATAAAARHGVPFRLRTYAMDQPGLVHRITHLLHELDANIEELETRLEPGSCSGTPLFTMNVRMTVPAQVPVRTLRQRLESLCDSLNCDVDLTPGE